MFKREGKGLLKLKQKYREKVLNVNRDKMRKMRYTRENEKNIGEE